MSTLSTTSIPGSTSSHTLRPSVSAQSVGRGSRSPSSTHTPLTSESALAQANGDPLVALETLITERNMLSGQNAQLWKLIERQRSVVKELERVRGERDRAIAQLGTGSGTKSRMEPSPSAPLGERPAPARHQSGPSSSPQPQTQRSTSDALQPERSSSQEGSNSSVSSGRPRVQRHQSEPDTSSPSSIPAVPTLSLTSPQGLHKEGSNSHLDPSPITQPGPNPTQTLTAMNASPSRSRAQVNRESRISLPGEASEYIKSMVDSPSPHQTTYQQAQHTPVTETQHVEEPSTYADSFVSMDSGADEKEIEESPFGDPSPESEDVPNHEPINTPTHDRTTYEPVVQHPPIQERSNYEPQPQTHPAHERPTEFHPRQPQPQPTQYEPQPTERQPPPPRRPFPNMITKTEPSLQVYVPPDPNADTATPSSAASQSPISTLATLNAVNSSPGPKFKSTRLAVTDLPHTKVRVQGSNIKTNDRGKELLSFLFLVYPAGDPPTTPSSRENWTVEKLYSEILALDYAVRSKLPKAHTKKLAPLPDSKLFKDHAPAKADARKAQLETYITSLVALPTKDRNEVCMFLSTDVVKGGAVMNPDHKEGYLTKRGKNFGGWKTRYFVLRSATLEYYESRGGTHLGSIHISGAQIGRQQKSTSGKETDDENSYRHAFLIIEAKRGPSGTSVRHVLCAESDEERDSWVDLLVKYVVADQQAAGAPDAHRYSTSTAASSSDIPSGTSYMSPAVARWRAQGMDGAAPKPSLDSVSEMDPMEGSPSVAKRILDRVTGGQSPEFPLSTSLPSNLDSQASTSPVPVSHVPHGLMNAGPPRANSEMGHYSDMSGSEGRVANGAPKQPRNRSSLHPASKSSEASPPESKGAASVKISRPIGGAPIPAGAKFGGDGPVQQNRDSTERDRKAKSGRFWGFGRAPAGAMVNRTVFGIPLEMSLAVAVIADLPAIVFRCIEYLEAKHAELEEGIYRLNGSANVIKSLKERFNTEGDVDLLKADEYWDPHAVAGLLKSFLRDLPTSLLTRELHLKFLGVIDLANQEERIDELASLVSQLPFANYSLLRALTAHLILIVQHSAVNRMTMRNLGIVFSPTLGIPAGVFSLMLGEFEQVFNVHAMGSDSSSSRPTGQELTTPVDEGYLSNRNSRSYADGAADTLLGLSGRVLKTTDEESDDGVDDDLASSSGTETENDTQGTGSPPATPGPNTYLRAAGPDSTPSSRLHNTAAQRGLQVTVTPGDTMVDRRASGLPSSPRPIRIPSGPTSPLTATPNPNGTKL